MEKSKGIQSKSVDTTIIENRLRSAVVGEIVTYAELTTLLGRDVREFCKGFMHTARKSLVNESVFFDVIPNEGYKRLNNEEACFVSQHYVDRARSASRTGIVHLQNVKYDELSEDGKKKHLTTSAQLGVIQMFATGRAAKKIGSKVNTDVSAQMAIGETLKLFGG